MGRDRQAIFERCLMRSPCHATTSHEPKRESPQSPTPFNLGRPHKTCYPDLKQTGAVGSSTNCGPSAGAHNCARVGSSLDRQVVCAHSNIGENEIVAVSTGGLQNKLNSGRKVTRPGPGEPADRHVDHVIAERLSQCLNTLIQDDA